MLETIIKIWKTGTVTQKVPFKNLSEFCRGELQLDVPRCDECGKCVEVCPMAALEIRDNEFRVFYYKCIFCGLCTINCPNGALRHTGKYLLAEKSKEKLVDCLK